MTLRSTLFLAAAIGSMIAPASAQANCGEGAFNGFYIGANTGWGWADAEQVTKGFVAEDSGSGFVAGVLSGYNLQCGKFLIGIESDFNFSDIETTSDYPPPDPAYLTSSIDWFGTLRGRLGYVHDEKYLIYATAGLAYADVDHKRFDPTFSFLGSDSDSATGWTVGGGIEWLRHANWSMRAEALFVDLGGATHTYTVTTGCGSVCRSTTDWEDDFWVTRIALTYRFGPEPEPAPLK